MPFSNILTLNTNSKHHCHVYYKKITSGENESDFKEDFYFFTQVGRNGKDYLVFLFLL